MENKNKTNWNNPEEVKEYKRNWRKTSAGKIKIREYLKRNRNRIREQLREYHIKNQKHRVEYAREYYQKNKEKWKEYYQKNKFKKLNKAGGI